MKQQSTITSQLCVWRRLTVGHLHQICSENQTKNSKLGVLKFQCAQNQKKSTQNPPPPHEAVKHHHIIAVCLAVAHSRPAPPKMFRKSNKYSKFWNFSALRTKRRALKNLHLRTQSSKAQSHHRSLWASTTKNVQKGTILFDHISFWAHSKKGTFQEHIPEQFWSLQPLVQANAGSSKSARRGAAAAADKSISSYPRSQSSRVPMRSAEGWSQLLFDRCGLHR